MNQHVNMMKHNSIETHCQIYIKNSDTIFSDYKKKYTGI